MKSKKTKKLTTLYLIVIILIIAIISIIFIVKDNNKPKLNEEYSAEYIASLLDKGRTCSNYYYYLSDDKLDTKTEFFVKDNIVKELSNSKLLRILDYTSGKDLLFYDGTDNYSSSDIYSANFQQAFFFYNDFKDTENYSYSFIEKTVIDGNTALAVSLTNLQTSIVEKYTIDLETGLILSKTISGFGIEETTIDRHIETNVVTDADISIPDLTSYKLVELQGNG